MTVAEFVNKVGFKVNEGDVNKVNNTISNIKQTATKVLGAIGIGLSLAAVNSLVEEFRRVNEQVENSTAALGDQAEIQKKIMQSARETHSSYAATAGVISDLVHESPELFGNIDEAVKFNNAATMLFKSAGKTNEEIAGLMEAINKSFAKGYVDSETISQLLERSPEAVELLNKKLGTTSDKLEEMASSRTMTVADLKAAFVENADAIEQKFGGVQYKITDALTVIRSEWGLWLSQMDSTLGITNTVARAITKVSDIALRAANRIRNAVIWLSDKLGGTENLLKLIAISVGAILIASKAGKVTGFLKNVVSFLGKINLKTLALVAVIILIALLVEDFINFMMGNDSLLGSMLEKAGIDAGKVRDTIATAFQAIKDIITSKWEDIKTFLAASWEVISTGLKAAFTVLTDLLSIFAALFSGDWKSLWEGIKKILYDFGAGILNVLGSILNGLWNLVGGVFTRIWEGITTTVGNIKQSIVDGFSAAIEWIKGLPDQALQWGADIIDNIVQGIRNAIGKVGDAVSGVAKKIRGFLGFSEPEEGPLSDFHTYMPDMISLMTSGIEAGKDKVRGALEALTGGMSVMANIGVASPETALSVAGSNNVSKSIVQNVNINNKFEGDRAGQQKSAAAMNKAGGDITKELAHGLAYTR